jgi:divalent metal cation (Fe/Co/Zn/Cd) transporter
LCLILSHLLLHTKHNKQRREEDFWEAVKESKDPTTFVVLLEDAAGLLGVVVAFAGILLDSLFNNGVYDGVASIAIGAILIAVSFVLAKESRSLLMGEPAGKKTLKEIIKIAENDSSIEKVVHHYSMYMAPEEVVLQLRTVFKDDLTTKQITGAIERVEAQIKERFPRIKQIFIEPA